MGQKFHTEFKYDDSINKVITIQNSYPKGGQKYTAQNGKEYVFAIFWTCITNETDTNLEIKIKLSSDSFIIPSSPNVNFNLYFPIEKMTLEKEPLPNYGLDLKLFLDKNIDKPTEFTTSISQNDSHLFYIVAISNQGINGVVRAGFELQKEKLIYKINNHEISCGQIITIE
tara:strand:- start:69879 stop:70391 length:513 start_codon:yes stop_codon:yes gene_type:complete